MAPLFILLFVALVAADNSHPGVAPLLTLNTGRTIPSFGLGTWLGFDKTGQLEPVKDNSVEEAVEVAIDAGYRLIDTAAVYDTEGSVGRAIKKKIAEGVVQRDDLYIVTKLWGTEHAKEAVAPALRQSLQKLDLPYVDLYLIHFPIGIYSNFSANNIDYLETWEGMIDAQAQGLTKAIGVSNFNIEQINRLINVTKVVPAVLQNEIQLNLQQPELLAFCRQHNITVMGYTPFGSLFHNKAKPDAPPPRTTDPAMVAIADKYNKTVPQIALRYLIELGVIPIPKSVTKKRIEQNIEVFDFQLGQEERDLLKTYDVGYRVLDISFWKDSPYYPY